MRCLGLSGGYLNLSPLPYLSLFREVDVPFAYLTCVETQKPSLGTEAVKNRQASVTGHCQ